MHNKITYTQELYVITKSIGKIPPCLVSLSL